MADTDVLVIGGGPGGYTTAIRAAQYDHDVTLVDRDVDLGGTCLKHGCIPSKALITASDLVTELEAASEMGIYTEPYVDVGEMVDWKDGVVDRLTTGIETLCRSNGVTLRTGTARFLDTDAVEISTEGGDAERLSFESAVIATGSRPIELPSVPFEADRVVDSKAALAFEAAPPSLAVIGAGYIGMELSTVFAKLGTDVTVVEMEDGILPQYDADLTRPVRERAESLGIDFEFGRLAVDHSQHTDRIVVHTEDEDGDRLDVSAARALVAVGREPVSDTVGLDAIDVELTDRGVIETDGNTRTTRSNVFAIGDVAGEPMLAHRAITEGICAAETIAGNERPIDARATPTAVFVDPEIATVGATDLDVRSAGGDPVVGEFPFAASGRSLTLGETGGFVRVVADRSDGRIHGAQIVGPEASELIGEFGVAIEAELTLEDIVGTTHAHPTLSEAVIEACEHALGRAIHTGN
jgi:dihydrolipoamide dehydrogenase